MVNASHLFSTVSNVSQTVNDHHNISAVINQFDRGETFMTAMQQEALQSVT